MQQQYKSHTIIITTWGNLDPDGFRPEYRISRKGPILSKSLKINRTFPTKKEAEAYTLEVAKKWIDEHGSDHPSTSTERGIDVTRKHPKTDSVF